MKVIPVRVLLLAGLLAVPTLFAQDKEKDKDKDKDKLELKVKTPYFPLREGSTWYYKISSGGSYTVKMTGLEKSGDEACAKLETRQGDKADGKLLATELVTVKADGVYRCGFAGSPATPPLLFLKLDPKDPGKTTKSGAKWTFKSEIAKQDVAGSFKLEETKDLTVGKTAYKNVVKVTSEGVAIDGQPVVITYYFAKGVGMIKQEVNVGGDTTTTELEKYTEAK
jgi:hypothetical protein